MNSNDNWYDDREKKDYDDDADRSNMEESQRLAIETVKVARDTLMVCATQSEQIENIDVMLDKQNHLVHQSTRTLRGMTWSGWIANKLTKSSSSKSHPSQTKENLRLLLLSSSNSNPYENVPSRLKPLSQAIINYNCNVLILNNCQNDPAQQPYQQQQLEGCQDICNALYDKVNQEFSKIESTVTIQPLLEEKEWIKELKQDQEHTRKLYEQIMITSKGNNNPNIISQTTTNKNTNNHDRNSRYCNNGNNNKYEVIKSGSISAEGEMLLLSASRDSNTSMESKIYKQEEHLSILSNNLEDLKDMGHGLNESIIKQNNLLDSFEDKAETLSDNTNILIRKSNAMKNRTSWKSHKKEFLHWIQIQHVQSKSYITTKDSGSVVLSSNNNDLSVFGMWRKYSDSSSSHIISLQNRFTRKWLGQTLISGSISCSSASCGYRDEWEMDNVNNNRIRTKLLCVSANWGNGGWIHVVPYNKEMILSADGYHLDAKKKAAIWSFIVVDE